MQPTERNVLEDETLYPCDFSAIMDCGQNIVPNFTGTEPPNNMMVGEYTPGKTFLEQYLENNPDVTFTRESIMRGICEHMKAAGHDPELAAQELAARWSNVGQPVMEEHKPIVDPVGDLIRHFTIFYEHVYLLQGYPESAQPQLNELKLLGQRIHDVLLNRDGSLNVENVTRCEGAHMCVTLDYGLVDNPDPKKRGVFIQVARDKAVLRQKV